MRRGLLGGGTLAACGGQAGRRGRTVVYASGADLQSVNPLVTVHPLAKQVERYVLLTTLVRYDSTLAPRPYLAREWTWTPDRQMLVLRLQSGVRWHDGVATSARDVAWTLNAARDPATGYPRLNDLADVVFVNDRDDSTVVIRFARPQRGIPDVLTDLAILPGYLLDSVPHAALRQAAWNAHPVGNGPFRFVSHESNRRWGFAANPDFPQALGGGPPAHARLVVVVGEPTTKLAARTDVAGRAVAFELLSVGSGEAPLEQMIQARLARVGVQVSIRLLELGAFLDRVNARRHDFDAAVVGTSGDPGLGYLGPLAELAGLRAPAEPAAAQRFFRDSLPVAFLYHGRGVQGMNRRVQGVRMDVRGELPAVTRWHVAP